jgi:peptide/nickel transport system substrate-binding protein
MSNGFFRRSPVRILTLAVLPLVALLSACGSSSKPQATSGSTTTTVPATYPTSHTLNLSFLEDPGQPPDPDVYYAGEGLLLTRNLYEGLVQYQPGTANRIVIPSLATSWSISGDGKTYTFQLRQGVKFHDGTTFTSAAVEPSFKRRAVVDGGPAYMVMGITKVTTPGPYTVVITLNQPNTAFLDYLASAYGPVMESPTAIALHAGSDHDQTYLETHDIGTGPYTLTEAKVGVAYQLQAFPGYWGPKPYYTTVNLPVIDDLSTEEIELNDGELAGIIHDLTTTAAVQYQKSSKFSFYELPVFEDEMVYVNENKGAFTSQAFRQAFLEAINIPDIVASVFPGGRAVVPDQIAPGHLIASQYAKQTIPYDPSVLTKLAAALPSGERDITLAYDTGAPDDQLIAEEIGAEMQGDGITAKVVGEETSSIYGAVGSVSTAKSAAAPNALVDYFWPDADNPYTWAHINYDPSGGLEYEACNVPGIANLDSEAAATGNLALYNQVTNLVQSSGCWLNMADKNDAMVFQPWVQGVAAAHVVAAPEMLLLSKLYPK